MFNTPQTINLVNPIIGNNGSLILTGTKAPTTIIGPGPNLLAVSGDDAGRVFGIAPGVTASISGLTVEDGSVTSQGGGLYNAGTVMLTNCFVIDNYSHAELAAAWSTSKAPRPR